MENLIVIRTLAQLKELEHYLVDKEYVSYDTETDGVEKESRIIGFSVCAEVEIGYYVILSYWDVEQGRLIDLETLSGAKAFIETLRSKSLIMQNAPFDCSMTNNYFKIDLMPAVHTDTMILGHLLNENRSNGLKELGVALFGEDARKEQLEMKESVHKNGGVLTREKYELYKADCDLIARYGAKDAILTLKVFHTLVPELIEQGLDTFFYDEESMPLLKGPTYQLNTTGLRVDPMRLQALKHELEVECMEAKAFIYKEITPLVAHKYPGTRPGNTFNIGGNMQLSWLLFIELKNPFNTLTKAGKELCQALDMRVPYSMAAKKEFIAFCIDNKDRVYEEAKYNKKTQKMGRPKKIGDPWKYLACGKETLQKLAPRYKWVEKLLEYKKSLKLLNTYVEGIQSRMKYNIIRPSFLQHGTTSGRYSSKNPNFQNLPRDDKRVKSCIVARQGKVFVGADYSQLEPRVFASFSKDERLLGCFEKGEDFYSVIGVEVFEKYGCSLKKDDPDAFAKYFPELRQISKAVGLSATYGTTAFKMSATINKTTDEAQEVINAYFAKFPSVKQFMLESHEIAKNTGQVTNLFGRPRRMPVALSFKEIYGNSKHADLPYEVRNTLNLAVNHRVQSTSASIMNRAAIAFYNRCKELEATNPLWKEVKLVLQVHDELNVEGPEELAQEISDVLKDAMENTVQLPGVKLIAEPKIANNLADLK